MWKRIALLVACFIYLSNSLIAQEETSSSIRRELALKGLSGIGVVADVDVGRGVGVNRDSVIQIQRDAGVRLRNAGINFLPDSTWKKSLGSPFLRIEISIYPDNEPDSYNIYYAVELIQQVSLVRNPSSIFYEVTWLKNKTQKAKEFDPREANYSINSMIDAFINDYLAANLAKPKK